MHCSAQRRVFKAENAFLNQVSAPESKASCALALTAAVQASCLSGNSLLPGTTHQLLRHGRAGDLAPSWSFFMIFETVLMNFVGCSRNIWNCSTKLHEL